MFVIKIKRLSYLLCILIFILILVGCSKDNQKVEKMHTNVSEKEKPMSGGTLMLPITQIDTLNPILNDNRSAYYLNMLIYDGLIRFDDQGKAQSALAKKWTVSSDGTEWIFELREDVKWHDGKPFTAEDVQFTIDVLKLNKGNKDGSIYSSFVQHIRNVEILKSNVIAIQSDSDLNNPIELFAFPIIPKHQFKSSQDVYKKIKMNPIGTGPYKVISNNQLDYIKLTVNDRYWGDKPYITKILGKRLPDKETAITSIDANEVSIAEPVSFDWEKYNENKTLTIYEYITDEYEFLGFNFNHSILKDKKMRKALAYGIDRHEIVNQVYLGHATVTDVPIYPDSFAYYEEAKKIGINLSKSKKLLSEAKWQNRDKDKWLEDEKGKKLELTLMVNEDNDLRVRTADLIASQLQKLGIKVTVDKVGWEIYQKRIASGKFDMVLGGWKLNNNLDLRFAFHSDAIGTTNFIRYTNQKMDTLLNAIASEKIEREREKKLNQMQNLLVEELPYFSLFFKNNCLIAKNDIRGNVNPKPFDLYHNIQKWYILKE